MYVYIYEHIHGHYIKAEVSNGSWKSYIHDPVCYDFVSIALEMLGAKGHISI